eukprot:gb/GECG01006186.1/.p1 GENE.gb/GECG01006186.1/~~gb/GECG01006186.1/.p1  ORF type:complete len:456 (+),score=40.70 gb/GECG01006186.1/:1-1368(+)
MSSQLLHLFPRGGGLRCTYRAASHLVSRQFNVCNKAYTGSPAHTVRSATFSTSDAKGYSPGSVVVWGKNDEAFGKVQGNQDTREPTLMDNLPFTAKKISCGGTQTAILTTKGEVYTVGKCVYFSLGHGEGSTTETTPRLVETLQGINIIDIDVGEHHCAAVSDEGEVFTWGAGGGTFGQVGGLGHGDKTTQSRPALVETLADQKIRVTQVSCGSSHTIALTDDGRVFTWGLGDAGRLGNGIRSQLVPEPVELLESERIIQVAAGKEFSMAVSEGGSAYGFGKNDQAQLGLGPNMIMDLNTMEQYPAKVTDLQGQVAMIGAGAHHCIALGRDGKVYTWGARLFIEPTEREEFNELPEDDRPVFVAAGEGTNAVITQKGHAYTWGKNLLSGALGQPGRTGKRQPAPLKTLEHSSLSQISLGKKHGGAVVGNPPKMPDVPGRDDPPAEEEEGFFCVII